MEGFVFVKMITDPDGSKTYGSYRSGSGILGLTTGVEKNKSAPLLGHILYSLKR
jgi:hypothetical protein